MKTNQKPAVMDENAMDEILDIVICRLFGNSQGHDPQRDELLGSYIAEIGLRVLHYCHLTTLPERLYETVAGMSIDLLRSEGVNLTGAGLSAALESVRLGDAQFGFGQASSVSQGVIDELLRAYAIDLHAHRTLAV